MESLTNLSYFVIVSCVTGCTTPCKNLWYQQYHYCKVGKSCMIVIFVLPQVPVVSSNYVKVVGQVVLLPNHSAVVLHLVVCWQDWLVWWLVCAVDGHVFIAWLVLLLWNQMMMVAPPCECARGVWLIIHLALLQSDGHVFFIFCQCMHEVSSE